MLTQHLRLIPILTIMVLLAASLSTQQLLHAEESDSFGFEGVVPGQTTEAELLRNEKWQNPLGPPVQAGAMTRRTYQFSVWRKVVAEVRDGIVVTIDIVPPERIPAKLLSDKVHLGTLTPIKSTNSLTQTFTSGPEDVSTFKMLRSGSARNVVLFVDESPQGKLYVQVMRIVSPKRLSGNQRQTARPNPRTVIQRNLKALITPPIDRKSSMVALVLRTLGWTRVCCFHEGHHTNFDCDQTLGTLSIQLLPSYHLLINSTV